MPHPPVGNTDPEVRSSGKVQCQKQGSPLPRTQTPELIRVNYIWRAANVITLRDVRISPSASYFLPLSSKHFPRNTTSRNLHI